LVCLASLRSANNERTEVSERRRGKARASGEIGANILR
jgi:hypothetical protein